MTISHIWSGAHSDDGCTVLCKATGTSVDLLVADNRALVGATTFGPSTPDAQNVTTFAVSGLDADTQYFYAFVEDNALATDPTLQGEFRTHPTADSQASYTLAIGCCAGDDPDVPGTEGLAPTRISNHPVFDTIRLSKPLLFAQIGDLHYYDPGDFVSTTTVGTYRDAYNSIHTCSRQSALYRSCQFDYVWDDHDFGGDNSDGTYAGKANAAQVYRERVPSYTLDDASSIYHSFKIGRVLYIASDTRYNRSTDATTDTSSKTMLGSTQISWMDTLLSGTDAEALVWLNPTPWLGRSSDTWNGFTNERNQLVQLFGDNGFLGKMVCFNGDYHGLAVADAAGNEWGGFPVFVIGSMDSSPSTQSFQYNLGPTSPGRNRWGQLRVSDRGHSIDLTGSAMVGASPWRTLTKRITTSTAFSTTFPAVTLPWKVEIAPGGDPLDPTTWTWVDITDDIRVGDGITIGYGRADEFSQVSPTSVDLTVDNTSGNYSPRNPKGIYFGTLGRNTPLRVSYNDIERATVFITELPPRWDQSGNDAYVPIKATGILRRLGQGIKPLRSPLFRSITSAANEIRPIGYWPFEDDGSAKYAASGLPGGQQMRLKLTGGNDSTSTPDSTSTYTFKSTVGPAGSDGGLQLPYGWAADAVCGAAAPSPVAWSVEYVQAPTKDTTKAPIKLHVLTAGGDSITPTDWALDNGDDSISLEAFDDDGNLLQLKGIVITTTTFPMHCIMTCVQDGSDIAINFFINGVEHTTSASTGRTLAMPRHVLIEGNDSTKVAEGYISHVAIWPYVLSQAEATARYAAFNAHVGELAGDRISRLCNEEGVPFYPVDGGGADTMSMGAQATGKFVDALREAETTDGGILHETRGGLAYLARSQRYNQDAAIALDIDDGDISAPPEPTDDDQKLRNDVIASRKDGASGEFVDQAHVDSHGLYDSTIAVNTEEDTVLSSVAGWQVHLGTVDDMRWPKLSLDLAGNTGLIPDWLDFNLAASRITVDQTLTQLPGVDIDVFTEGWTEQLNEYDWNVDLNTVPAKPWAVGGLSQAPSFVASSKEFANATSITVALPTGWEAGQLAILALALNSSSATVTVPTGWTGIDTPPNVASSMQAGVWWRILADGDTDPVFAFSAQQKTSAVLATYTGHHPTDPIGDFGAATRSSSSTDTLTGAADTTEDHQRIVAVFMDQSSTATEFVSVPTTLSMRGAQFGTGTGSNSVGIFDQVVEDEGTVAAMTATMDTASGNGYGLAFVLQSGALDAADRMDTDGSTLQFDITSSDTSMVVRTTDDDSPLWTTDAGQVPFLVRMDGEVVKATDIASAAKDTFNRSTSSGWGTADEGGAWTVEAGAAANYSVGAGFGGRIGLTPVGTRHYIVGATDLSDIILTAEITVPALATGNQILAGLLARSNSTATAHYMLQIAFGTSGTHTVTVYKLVSGSFHAVTSTVSFGSYSAGDTIKVKWSLVGPDQKVWLWHSDATKPRIPTVTASDPEYQSGRIGAQAALLSGNTNTLPVNIDFDNIEVANPQTFTIVRSINGISKSHDAGVDVRLEHPIILGL